jgi:hypothetical protein
MKKILIAIIMLAGIKTMYAQKTGIGLTAGTIYGPGLTITHYYDEKNGMKFIVMPPIFYDGEIVLTGAGLEYRRILSERRKSKIFFFASASIVNIDSEYIYVLPTLGISDEVMITDNQAIGLNLGWSGYLYKSDYPQKNTYMWQSFPSIQIDYVFYFE